LARLDPGSAIVFTLPAAIAWPLPVYELALLTAAFLADGGLDGVTVTIVTPEDAPLGLFGADASESVRRLLDESGVDVLTGRYPASVDEGVLALVPGGSIRADAAVALPRLGGPRLAGLPHDPNGFLPTDPFGRVRDVDDVFAAGDVTSFPIKQGGL